jgi:HEAT repeat protein
MMRRMMQGLLALSVLFVVPCQGGMEEADFDELFLAISEYGDTAVKRARKGEARKVWSARHEESLRYVMSIGHVRHVWVSMLMNEFTLTIEARKAAPIFAAGLRSPHVRGRKVAAYFFGAWDTPAYIADVLPLLDDDEIANNAIRTLGKWYAVEAVPRVIEHLDDMDDERRRIVSINALKDIGDPRAVAPLIKRLGDPVFTVRMATVEALSRFGAAAERALLDRLPDATGRELRLVIRTLGLLQARAAIGPLRARLESPHWGVRAAAVRALRMIDIERSADWLAGMAEGEHAAVRAALVMDPAVDLL